MALTPKKIYTTKIYTCYTLHTSYMQHPDPRGQKYHVPIKVAGHIGLPSSQASSHPKTTQSAPVLLKNMTPAHTELVFDKTHTRSPAC